MCLRKIWPQRFLDSPHHLLDGFWGPQDGFFGFSSGGYRERGVQLAYSHIEISIHIFNAEKHKSLTDGWINKQMDRQTDRSTQ